MVIAVWVLMLFLLGVWSLTAWGLHALLTLDPSRLGDLKLLIDRIPYGEVISQWIPGWQDLLRMTIDFTQVLLGWIGSAAPVVVWVVWGIGTLGILLTGALLTLLVKLMRRSSPPPRAPA